MSEPTNGKSSRPYVPGMTLMPGESAYIDIPIPPEIADAMRKGGTVRITDISAETYGKYQHCTMADDGMFYADSDLQWHFGRYSPKPGALPSPHGQNTPELTAHAHQMHEDAARRLTEIALVRPRKSWLWLKNSLPRGDL